MAARAVPLARAPGSVGGGDANPLDPLAATTAASGSHEALLEHIVQRLSDGANPALLLRTALGDARLCDLGLMQRVLHVLARRGPQAELPPTDRAALLSVVAGLREPSLTLMRTRPLAVQVLFHAASDPAGLRLLDVLRCDPVFQDRRGLLNEALVLLSCAVSDEARRLPVFIWLLQHSDSLPKDLLEEACRRLAPTDSALSTSGKHQLLGELARHPRLWEQRGCMEAVSLMLGERLAEAPLSDLLIELLRERSIPVAAQAALVERVVQHSEGPQRGQLLAHVLAHQDLSGAPLRLFVEKWVQVDEGEEGWKRNAGLVDRVLQRLDPERSQAVRDGLRAGVIAARISSISQSGSQRSALQEGAAHERVACLSRSGPGALGEDPKDDKRAVAQASELHKRVSDQLACRPIAQARRLQETVLPHVQGLLQERGLGPLMKLSAVATAVAARMEGPALVQAFKTLGIPVPELMERVKKEAGRDPAAWKLWWARLRQAGAKLERVESVSGAARPPRREDVAPLDEPPPTGAPPVATAILLGHDELRRLVHHALTDGGRRLGRDARASCIARDIAPHVPRLNPPTTEGLCRAATLVAALCEPALGMDPDELHRHLKSFGLDFAELVIAIDRLLDRQPPAEERQELLCASAKLVGVNRRLDRPQVVSRHAAAAAQPMVVRASPGSSHPAESKASPSRASACLPVDGLPGGEDFEAWLLPHPTRCTPSAHAAYKMAQRLPGVDASSGDVFVGGRRELRHIHVTKKHVSLKKSSAAHDSLVLMQGGSRAHEHFKAVRHHLDMSQPEHRVQLAFLGWLQGHFDHPDEGLRRLEGAWQQVVASQPPRPRR